MSERYIRFQDVKKSYGSGEAQINALAGVDFEIEKAENIWGNFFQKVPPHFYFSITDFLEKILAYFSAGNLKRRS